MKKTSIIVSFLLMATFFVGINLLIENVKAGEIWHVDSSTGINFATIQDALDSEDVDVGDTILVHVGSGYHEDIVIDYSISLIAYNYNNLPYLYGEDNNSVCITISPCAKNVEINGFRIRPGTYNIGEQTYGHTGVTGILSGSDATEHETIWIKNIDIEECYNGIEISKTGTNYPQHHTIEDSEITLCANDGIVIESNPNPISGFYYANNIVRDSDISNNGRYGTSISGDWNYVRNCIMNENGDHGLYVCGDYNDIWEDDGLGSISEMEMCENGGDGIRVIGDDNNMYDGIYVYLNDGYGIYLAGDDNWIDEIHIRGHNYGLFMVNSDSNNIDYLETDYNSIYGVKLDNSDYNSFDDCYFEDKVLIYNSCFNNISSSDFYLETTLELESSSSANDFYDCSFDSHHTYNCVVITQSNTNHFIICDFEYGYHAFEIYGSVGITIYGQNNGGVRSTMDSYDDTIIKCDVDDNDNGSTFYIKNYDIPDYREIHITGGSPSQKSTGYWNNIPNEGDLGIYTTYGEWLETTF